MSILQYLHSTLPQRIRLSASTIAPDHLAGKGPGRQWRARGWLYRTPTQAPGETPRTVFSLSIFQTPSPQPLSPVTTTTGLSQSSPPFPPPLPRPSHHFRILPTQQRHLHLPQDPRHRSAPGISSPSSLSTSTSPSSHSSRRFAHRLA